MMGRSMKMKTFLFTFALFFLAGCASSPSNESGPAEVSAKKAAAAPSEAASADEEAAAVKPFIESPAALAKSATPSVLQDAIKSGNEDSIRKAAIAGLMQNSNDVMSLNAMGLYEYRKGRPLAGKLFFNKALTVQPNSSELYSNIGLTYLALGDEFEAIRSFRKALELNPNDINAAINLGSIYLEHRDFDKAFTVYNLSSGRSRDIKFLNNFAIASAAHGKLEQADGLYRDALKMSPGNRELLLNYAIFQVEYQGKFKDGLETLDRLKLIGLGEGMNNKTKELENKAKAGLK